MVSMLIIDHFYQQVKRHGQKIIINILCKRFWKKGQVKPQIPIMGKLQCFRTELYLCTEPTTFIKIGINYVGSLEVTVKRSHTIGYIELAYD